MLLSLLLHLSTAHGISCDDATLAVLAAPDVRAVFEDSVRTPIANLFANRVAEWREIPHDDKLTNVVDDFWEKTPASEMLSDLKLKAMAPHLRAVFSCRELKKAAKHTAQDGALDTRHGAIYRQIFEIAADRNLDLLPMDTMNQWFSEITQRHGDAFLVHLEEHFPACPTPEVSSPVEPWTVPADANPALLDPTLATETAPERFHLHLQTTKGLIVIDIRREHDPLSVDRIYNLARIGFLDGTSFHRAIDNFVVQFGISPYPAVTAAWEGATMQDVHEALPNERGVLSMARGAPHTRRTQLFINRRDNPNIDKYAWGGVGRVIEGLEVLDAIDDCYGEVAPRGNGPSQKTIREQGRAYVDAAFPALDHIERAWVEPAP